MVERENMTRAYQRVLLNHGSAGIGKISVIGLNYIETAVYGTVRTVV